MIWYHENKPWSKFIKKPKLCAQNHLIVYSKLFYPNKASILQLPYKATVACTEFRLLKAIYPHSAVCEQLEAELAAHVIIGQSKESYF